MTITITCALAIYNTFIWRLQLFVPNFCFPVLSSSNTSHWMSQCHSSPGIFTEESKAWPCTIHLCIITSKTGSQASLLKILDKCIVNKIFTRSSIPMPYLLYLRPRLNFHAKPLYLLQICLLKPLYMYQILAHVCRNKTLLLLAFTINYCLAMMCWWK